MAGHQGVLLKRQTISNGAVVFYAHCADDVKNADGSPKHVSTHTCYVEKAFGELKTREEIRAEVNAHLQRVEDLHRARLLAEEIGAEE